MEVNAANGIVDLGAVDINSVSEAPSSGYANDSAAVFGHTYAIELSDGTYALVQSTSWQNPPPWSITTDFRYRHQKNGTRDFD